MGGFGSGRLGGFGRDTVESCRSIDVNRLHKTGCLVPGWRGGWEWKRDGERVAWISMRAEERRLVLSYNYRRNGEEWQSVEEPVPIVPVPCRLGGTRPYFICPAVVNGATCDRRVTKLYGPGRYFLCRHCYRLAYASQSEGAWDRALRRANTIRTRLGGNPDMAAPFPDRPKGMWRRTYDRLRDDAIRAESMADEAFIASASRFLSKVGETRSPKGFWQ